MISQANLQQGQPYGYQVLRTGAQPTAEATAVTADPTTAVATPDATALTAQPADAYTSSTTALAPAPEVEKKAKPNWLAWGALAAGGASAIYWLATRGRGGAEVSKTVAEAAPKAGEAVAEAGQQVATAATKAADDVKNTLSHMFGDIDLNDTPKGVAEGITDLIDKRKNIPTAQLKALESFDPAINAQKAARINYSQFPIDHPADPTQWKNLSLGSTKVKRMVVGNASELNTLKELAEGDPIAKAKLLNGRFEIDSIGAGQGVLRYKFVPGPIINHEADGVVSFYRYARATKSTTALEDTRVLAKKLGFDLVEDNAQGVKIGNKNGNYLFLPSEKHIAGLNVSNSGYEFYHANGTAFTAQDVKDYFASLTHADKAIRDQHHANWGRHTVSVGAVFKNDGTLINSGKITIKTSNPSSEEVFF
jgi:hypothetical protein